MKNIFRLIVTIDSELGGTSSTMKESTVLVIQIAKIMQEIKEYAYHLDQIGKK